MTRATWAASVAFTLVASTALAQGNSQKNKPKPPSRNDLAPAAPSAPASTGATPLAWIDDASLLSPGQMALSVSAMHWQGNGVGEVDAPIVDAAFGLAPRVQLSASIPHVSGGADPSGAAGGVGTSFFSAKIALHEMPAYGFKVAVAPTLQLLGSGVVESLGVQQDRIRWGVPVSAEVSSGSTRLYGGGGYFSPGLWFSGVAVAFRREIEAAPDPEAKRRELEEQLAARRDPYARAESYGVADLIDPRHTRRALCQWIELIQPGLAHLRGPRAYGPRP